MLKEEQPANPMISGSAGNSRSSSRQGDRLAAEPGAPDLSAHPGG